MLFSGARQTPAEMTELARRYANGIGCPRDAGQAMLWYRRAAQEGEPGAMTAIADMLEEGRCVDQDLVAAVAWYRRAANLGFAPAMVRVAGMLERGRGARIDRGRGARMVSQGCEARIRSRDDTARRHRRECRVVQEGRRPTRSARVRQTRVGRPAISVCSGKGRNWATVRR